MDRPKTSLPSSEAWWTKTRGVRTNEAYFKNLTGDGADTLTNMILRQIAAHIDHVDVQLLEQLGWHYGKKIFVALQNNETLSLRSYLLFCSAFPMEETIRSSAYEKIISVNMKTRYTFDSIPQKLTTFSFHGLTFLTLGPFDFQAKSLYSLSRISSLAVLVLHNAVKNAVNPNPSESLNDYTVRKWIDNAVETHKLPKLRVLIFRQFDLTDKVLEPLSALTQVELVNLPFRTSHVDQNYRTTGRAHCPPDWEEVLPWHLQSRNSVLLDLHWLWTIVRERDGFFEMIEDLYNWPPTYHGLPGPKNSLARLHLQFHDSKLPYQDIEGDRFSWFLRTLPDPRLAQGKGTLKREADHELKDQDKRRRRRNGKQASIEHVLRLFS